MAHSYPTLATERTDGATAPTYQAASRGPVSTPRKTWAIRWVFPNHAQLPTVVNGERVTVGRSRRSDFRLDGLQVSAHHATLAISSSEPGILVQDQSSTNGVFVNGTKLYGNAPCLLHSGDVVRFGEFVGIVDQIPSTEAAIPNQIDKQSVTVKFELDNERGIRRVESQTLGLVVGPATRAAIASLQRAAPTDCNVVLVGETGTGKEYVAKAVHAWSQRRGQYVGLNCWDLKGDPGLARARLFGVEAGAFAGAVPLKGAFRDADGGTLLLDEIAELPLEVQPMLLRALQERQIQPVGGRRPVSVDVRLVVATKRSVEEQVAAGTFSLDLYQRLAGLTVELPPLRARKTDIPFLFLTTLGWEPSLLSASGNGQALDPNAVEPELIEALCVYGWPGNLRELTTVAGNFRKLWDHAGQTGFRFRRDDLPWRCLSTKGNPPSRDRDRRDAANLEALIEQLRAGAQSLGIDLMSVRPSDVNFEQACVRAGIQRSLGYRQFKRWDDLAAKGLMELPRDEFERFLYRRHVEGKRP